MPNEIERDQGAALKSSASNNAVTPSSLVTALQREYPSWVGEVIEAFGEVTIVVPRELIVGVCSLLKSAPGLEFNFLADVSGVDRGPEEEQGSK